MPCNTIEQQIRKIAVLTSGGDAPGMNAAIASAVQVAASAGVEVVGVEEGYEGLINRNFRSLVERDPQTGELAPIPELPRVGGQGGTMLGTGRSPRFFDPEHRSRAARALHDCGVDALVVIGGNGSMEGLMPCGRNTRWRWWAFRPPSTTTWGTAASRWGSTPL